MKEITAKEAEQIHGEKSPLVFLDVREVEEVQEGKIPGALHIPLGLLEFRMQELDKKQPYLLVCRSGGRSGRAAEFLESHGFDVTNMTGGMLEWEGKTE
ncbi:rhodanese-like domain-containing protein [Marinicrinis sediminis]|uniref:Rhodanese-like domain-containing protein n=1 Tax=Marinicrinis sediminis TaxID=1652465 RepID=A0ABW5REX1_9BACL